MPLMSPAFVSPSAAKLEICAYTKVYGGENLSISRSVLIYSRSTKSERRMTLNGNDIERSIEAVDNKTCLSYSFLSQMFRAAWAENCSFLFSPKAREDRSPQQSSAQEVHTNKQNGS